MHHNAKISHDSIKKKVELLELWANIGVPEKTDATGYTLSKNGEPEYIDIPSSMNKFLRWSDAKNGLKSTSQKALDNYLHETKRDASFIPSLLRQAQQRLSKQKLENSTSDLKVQLKAAWQLINSQTVDITKLLSEVESLKDDVNVAQSEQENIELAAAMRIEALESELTSVKDQLSKLRQLRVV